MAEDSRPPTKLELSLLERMLAVDFAGNEELREQLSGLRVKTIDEDGGLSLFPQPADPWKSGENILERDVPVEGEFLDSDGGEVFVLLHVVRGFLHELEFYRGDGAVVIGEIPVERVYLFAP
jgi:hypothetical protein